MIADVVAGMSICTIILVTNVAPMGADFPAPRHYERSQQTLILILAFVGMRINPFF